MCSFAGVFKKKLYRVTPPPLPPPKIHFFFTDDYHKMKQACPPPLPPIRLVLIGRRYAIKTVFRFHPHPLPDRFSSSFLRNEQCYVPMSNLAQSGSFFGHVLNSSKVFSTTPVKFYDMYPTTVNPLRHVFRSCCCCENVEPPSLALALALLMYGVASAANREDMHRVPSLIGGKEGGSFRNAHVRYTSAANGEKRLDDWGGHRLGNLRVKEGKRLLLFYS